ncbi:MAG: hypothetical protein AAF806_05335, partial [Bacteroidota bacterium]
FKHIREEQIGGIAVYAAQLEKEEMTLHTFWWYDNGEHQMIRENEWRWKAIKNGEGYRLVNVTSPNEEIVSDEVKTLIDSSF